MPRIPQVTRTMTTTLATVQCMDIENEQLFKVTIRIPRTYKTDRALLKQIKSAIETEKLRVVYIIDSKTETAKFTMTEQQYIDAATILEIINEKEIKQ